MRPNIPPIWVALALRLIPLAGKTNSSKSSLEFFVICIFSHIFNSTSQCGHYVCGRRSESVLYRIVGYHGNVLYHGISYRIHITYIYIFKWQKKHQLKESMDLDIKIQQLLP